MINVLDHGFQTGDQYFNNSILLNNLIANLGTDREIYFPAGTYYFNTPLDIINIPVVFKGCGINNTALIRNYTESDLNKALIIAKETIIIKNLSIHSGQNCTGGGAIRLDGLSASASVLRDLYITGLQGGTWHIPLVLNGPEQLGIRSCYIDNVELFAATIHLFWFINTRGLTANIQGYPAGGSANHGTIQQSGSYRPSNIDIRTRYLETLYLYSTDNFTILSTPKTNIIQTNCTNIKVY